MPPVSRGTLGAFKGVRMPTRLDWPVASNYEVVPIRVSTQRKKMTYGQGRPCNAGARFYLVFRAWAISRAAHRCDFTSLIAAAFPQ